MEQEVYSHKWKPCQANVLKRFPLFYYPDGTISFNIDNMGMYKGYKAKAIAGDGTMYEIDTVDSRFIPRDDRDWAASPYDALIVEGLTPEQAETIVRFEQGDEGDPVCSYPW